MNDESGGVALLPFYHSSFIIHRSGNGQAIPTGKRWEPILAGRAPTPAKARFLFLWRPETQIVKHGMLEETRTDCKNYFLEE